LNSAELKKNQRSPLSSSGSDKRKEEKYISKKELTPQCQDYIRSSDSVVVVAMEAVANCINGVMQPSNGAQMHMTLACTKKLKGTITEITPRPY
jgi:hypothetical protein